MLILADGGVTWHSDVGWCKSASCIQCDPGSHL